MDNHSPVDRRNSDLPQLKSTASQIFSQFVVIPRAINNEDMTFQDLPVIDDFTMAAQQIDSYTMQSQKYIVFFITKATSFNYRQKVNISHVRYENSNRSNICTLYMRYILQDRNKNPSPLPVQNSKCLQIYNEYLLSGNHFIMFGNYQPNCS